ncbi:MAG TPA: response regulator [Casimicrobiaceae bacterium]|nr:response regulator [Casimicrobiaceae bacterium]
MATRAATDASVLVVDDNRDSVEGVAMMLELSGHPVVRAYSAPEALDLLDENKSIGLVLSDVKMPKLDGYDFFRVVAHRYPKLPVVLMTGYPILDDDDPPPHADVLTKPFDAKLLERITSRYLAGATS